jgi:subtilisin family serine protease
LKIGHGSFNAYVGKFDEAAIRIIEKLDEVLSVCQDEYVYVDAPNPVSGEHSTYPTASDLPTGQAQAYPTGAVYPTAKYPVANNTVHDYPTGAVYPTAKYSVANNTVPHYPTASPSGISSARPSYGSSIPYKPAGNVTKQSLVTQENSIYSLADISHKNGVSGLSTFTYIYDASAGAGMTAYVFDTGIRASHQEFEGRVRFGINGLTGSKTSAAKGANDNDGHGTHVAGTLIGKTFGAAKKASAVDVKVFDGSAVCP